MKGLLLMFMFFASCREFYDDEFLEAQEGGIQEAQAQAYQTTINPINQGTFTELTGNALVAVSNGSVKVDIDLAGIPANVIQIHYGFIAADCTTIQPPFITPAGNSTRTYTLSETMSTEALNQDLQSSGAVSTPQDIGLAGKSLVIKAFSNFAGTPSPTGTNQTTIACGELAVSQDDTASNDDIFNPDPANPDPANPFPDNGDVGGETFPPNPFPFPDTGDVGSENPSPF